MKKELIRMLRPCASGLAAACILCCASCSCSKPDVEAILADATAARDEGNFTEATSLCNEIASMLQTADSVNVSPDQAARLGIIYMRLSETTDRIENVAEASRCIDFAMRHSTDALDGFGKSLPVDDLRHLDLALRITGSYGRGCDSISLPEEPLELPDSLIGAIQ